MNFPEKKKKKKKREILNDSKLRMPLRSRTLFFHSVHTFVVYRSIAAMYKLTITPHIEHRTFSHINTRPSMLIMSVSDRWKDFFYNVHVIYL